MGAVETSGLAHLAVAKEVGHKAFLDAVQDKIEGCCRVLPKQSIGAGDEALTARLAHGDKLSGGKVERRDLLNVEFEVFRLLRKKYRADEPGSKQGVFHVLP